MVSDGPAVATTSIEAVMLLKNQNLAEPKPPTERQKLRWNVLLGDLRFLASVTLARFIVWRTLRRRCRENSARRREFRLLRGEVSPAQAEPQVVQGFDWRANAVASGNRVLRKSGKQGG